ncbi:hypothetical protein N2152v2_005304 [Parachlorella kessleri]
MPSHIPDKGQLTLQAFLSSRKRKRTAGDAPQTVPRLRSALAQLDSLRGLYCAARDIASLAIALGLRRTISLAGAAARRVRTQAALPPGVVKASWKSCGTSSSRLGAAGGH